MRKATKTKKRAKKKAVKKDITVEMLERYLPLLVITAMICHIRKALGLERKVSRWERMFRNFRGARHWIGRRFYRAGCWLLGIEGEE